VEERPIGVEEARRASELLITSTTREISPVEEWDAEKVGGAREVTVRLHQALQARVRSQCGM
jgi:branched-subunit amino acid aminotransferase/4-amino-4-deoxychorismate lyase